MLKSLAQSICMIHEPRMLPHVARDSRSRPRAGAHWPGPLHAKVHTINAIRMRLAWCSSLLEPSRQTSSTPSFSSGLTTLASCCRGRRGSRTSLAVRAATMMPRRPFALVLVTCATALVAPTQRLPRLAPLQSEPGPQPPAPEPEKPRPEPRPVIMPTVTGSNGEQIDVVSRLLKDRILLLGSRAVP